jgi:hypothetical protein
MIIILTIDMIFMNSFIFFDFTLIICIEENIVEFCFEIIFEGLNLLHVLIIEGFTIAISTVAS